MHNIIDETMINQLRDTVSSTLSPHRLRHTLGVEQMSLDIGKEFMLDPYDLILLRCAALLHDITKEYSFEKQLKICSEFGIMLRDDEISCPPVLHAITAAAIIPTQDPNFNIPEIVSSVRWHTTGKRDMSLLEKIICFADYIEYGRQYESCVKARNSFWSEIKLCDTVNDKYICLDKALKQSLDSTVANITNKGGVVNADTLEAIMHLDASH